MDLDAMILMLEGPPALAAAGEGSRGAVERESPDVHLANQPAWFTPADTWLLLEGCRAPVPTPVDQAA